MWGPGSLPKGGGIRTNPAPTEWPKRGLRGWPRCPQAEEATEPGPGQPARPARRCSFAVGSQGRGACRAGRCWRHCRPRQRTQEQVSCRGPARLGAPRGRHRAPWGLKPLGHAPPLLLPRGRTGRRKRGMCCSPQHDAQAQEGAVSCQGHSLPRSEPLCSFGPQMLTERPGVSGPSATPAEVGFVPPSCDERVEAQRRDVASPRPHSKACWSVVPAPAQRPRPPASRPGARTATEDGARGEQTGRSPPGRPPPGTGPA